MIKHSVKHELTIYPMSCSMQETTFETAVNLYTMYVEAEIYCLRFIDVFEAHYFFCTLQFAFRPASSKLNTASKVEYFGQGHTHSPPNDKCCSYQRQRLRWHLENDNLNEKRKHCVQVSDDGGYGSLLVF